MIFSEELFYPESYSEVDEIFDSTTPEAFDLSRPYTYHMYDFLTKNRAIRRGSVYELVAKAFCPTMHSTYPGEFSAQISN